MAVDERILNRKLRISKMGGSVCSGIIIVKVGQIIEFGPDK